MKKYIRYISAAAAVLISVLNVGAAYNASVENGLATRNFSAGSGDHSAALNQLIQANKSNGAIITLLKGNYRLKNIRLPSNIHLKIQAGSTIRLPQAVEFSTNSQTIFLFGDANGGRPRNVSISGVRRPGRNAKKFKVYLDPPQNGRANRTAIATTGANNFRIANMTVFDGLTNISSIKMGRAGGHITSNGTVRNCGQVGSTQGYGLIQSQSCIDMLFENLKCEGGVTLRLETGLVVINNEQNGLVDNVVANNIRSSKGAYALLMSPHSLDNGVVHSRGVHGDGSAFAAHFQAGFRNPDRYTVDRVGKFDRRSTSKQITAAYSPSKAQERLNFYRKYLKNYPVENAKIIPGATRHAATGPSVAPVLKHPNTKYTVSPSDVSYVNGRAFPSTSPGRNIKIFHPLTHN